MTGKRNCRAAMRRASDAQPDPVNSTHARRHGAAASRPARAGAVIATAMLLLALALQCVEARGELLFRSAAQINGQQHWSDLRNYADPADTAYLRAPADGTQAAAEEVQVFIHGYITSADLYGAKVMESLLKRGRHKIAGNVVAFASYGGEVDAAMELGRMLRKLGVSTVVAEGEQCLSSCLFAFMGGDRRSVAGRIGIHRPYFSSAREVPDRRLHYRQLQKRLREYIEELDFPPSLYEAVMAVPPQSVNILTASDLKRFYLEGMSPSAEDEAYAASARVLGISVTEYLEQQSLRCADVSAACGGEAQQAAGNSTAKDEPTRRERAEPASANPALGRAAGAEKAVP